MDSSNATQITKEEYDLEKRTFTDLYRLYLQARADALSSSDKEKLGLDLLRSARKLDDMELELNIAPNSFQGIVLEAVSQISSSKGMIQKKREATTYTSDNDNSEYSEYYDDLDLSNQVVQPFALLYQLATVHDMRQEYAFNRSIAGTTSMWKRAWIIVKDQVLTHFLSGFVFCFAKFAGVLFFRRVSTSGQSSGGIQRNLHLVLVFINHYMLTFFLYEAYVRSFFKQLYRRLLNG
ncbi:hypothetical protein V1511DRAFT_487263 [Dipodascopsis uninucleata]